MEKDNAFGSEFERILVGLLAVVTGVLLVYLALQGPLFLGNIRYKSHPVINNQILGQDVVNLFLLSLISLAGGIALWLRRAVAKYLLLLTPLYLIYFVLSYTIGWEWSSPAYTGNSEKYFFHFLFILVAAVLVMLYSLSVFPRDRSARFNRKGLAVYSALLVFFMLAFAAMWMKEVFEVMARGTTRGYDIAPTAFWLVRVFDLGFTIPLGLLSVYLLWTRPASSFPIQFMFYGFFCTMVVAVNAMGIIMWLKKDPTFLFRDLAVFLILGLIVFAGFVYILRNFKRPAA
ncbi:MAG: hypothetical protein MUC72_11305 [Acidobacteria bacterium]|jgi:hypothetical protein|nr:hypothetical protein [Acidobacteriota bacterium]